MNQLHCAVVSTSRIIAMALFYHCRGSCRSNRPPARVQDSMVGRNNVDSALDSHIRDIHSTAQTGRQWSRPGCQGRHLHAGDRQEHHSRQTILDRILRRLDQVQISIIFMPFIFASNNANVKICRVCENAWWLELGLAFSQTSKPSFSLACLRSQPRLCVLKVLSDPWRFGLTDVEPLINICLMFCYWCSLLSSLVNFLFQPSVSNFKQAGPNSLT